MVRQFTLIISILLFVSCASRKVDVSKVAEVAKLDSSIVVKVDGTYVKDNNVVIIESTDEVEYVAKDTSKPMEIEGKLFKNVIIKSKKSKTTTIDKTKENKRVSSIKKLNVKKKLLRKSLKKTDKKANYFIYLWLLIIPVGMYVYRQIKNKILL